MTFVNIWMQHKGGQVLLGLRCAGCRELFDRDDERVSIDYYITSEQKYPLRVEAHPQCKHLVFGDGA